MSDKRSFRHCGLSLLALAFLATLLGCTYDPEGNNLNAQIGLLDASATMRVEVEVYKGPLSKEPAIQLGELEGIIDDSKQAMDILLGNMDYSRIRMECNMGNRCDESEDIVDKINITAGRLKCKDIEFVFSPSDKRRWDDWDNRLSEDWPQECNALRHLFHDVLQGLEHQENVAGIASARSCTPKQQQCSAGQSCLPERSCTLNNSSDHLLGICGFDTSLDDPNPTAKNPKRCALQLGKISAYGSYLKRRAAYWAAEHVATSPLSTRLRIEMTNFAQFAAEYGNQITSRADALLKQASGAQGIGILREQLPNSTYLRDSSPTAYLNLYDWNKAAVQTGRETKPAERVRMVEHLVSDNYWSRINTVFAAGQGDVSMALVKDDIGNWNLKSFDNSPGELLKAYKDLGLAAVKATVELARKGSGLPKAKDALNFANQIALGSTSGGRVKETEERLMALRLETARLIKKVGDDQNQRKAELEKQIGDLTTKIEGDGDINVGLKGAYRTAKSNLDAQVKVSNDLETRISEREGNIRELRAQISRLKQQRDDAIEIRDALTVSEDSGVSAAGDDGEAEATPPNTNESQITMLNVKIGELNGQIISTANVLSDALEQQSQDLESLEDERARRPALQQEVDMAKKKLGETEASKSLLEAEHVGLTKAAAAQIERLLDLHSALVAKMAIAAAEGAGSSAAMK